MDKRDIPELGPNDGETLYNSIDGKNWKEAVPP
jgi:hypothetical protein